MTYPGMPRPKRLAKPFTLTAPSPLESAEQQAFFRWVRLMQGYHKPGAGLIFAIPNQRKGAAEGARFKAEGVLAGVPDIFVAVPRLSPGSCENPDADFHGLWIELKRVGGSLADCSAAQNRVMADLAAQGYRVEVCFGWQHAMRVTREYLGWGE